MFKMRFKSIILCCGMALMTTMLVSCGNKNRQTPEGRAQSYQTMTIALTDKTVTNSYSASIKGKQDIDIYPQISGTVSAVCVTEGQHVKKGQKLFIIEQGTYYAALNQAIANVQAAEASLASSQLAYDSKESLYRDAVISEYELLTARNALANAEANLAQAKAQEASARTNYNYTFITSPADGVVGNLPYFQGALVSSAISQPLTTISDNSEMYVYFSITEKQLLALSREYGSTAKALKKMPEISLQLSDGSEYDKTGKIESISGVVDKSTGSTSLRAIFPNSDGLLHSGFSGTVKMPSVYKDCVVIPQSATTEIQDKIFVYKVVDGKAQSTQIQVVATDSGTEYVVMEGLQAGDVVISTGAGLVRNGAGVNSDARGEEAK